MRFYAPSQMRSVRDTAGFTKLKYRQDGQGNLNDLKNKDIKTQLEYREKEHFSKISREEFISMCFLMWVCFDLFCSRLPCPISCS